MVLFLALPLLLIAYFLLWVKYTQNYWERRRIPHKQPTFILGNIDPNRHWSSTFSELYNKYKGTTAPFAGYYLFSAKAALILDLELVKNILIKDFNNFEDRGIYHNERDDPLSGNLFFLDSENWRKLRRKMSPTFSSGKMKLMFSTVEKVGKELEAVVLEKVGDDGAKTLEISDFLGRFTADAIGACAFGLECNSLLNSEAEFVKMGKSFFVQRRHSKIVEAFIHAFPNIARALHMRLTHQSVHDFYMSIVSDTIKYREKNNVRRNDFMDIMLDLSKGESGLTNAEIAAQAFGFFIAGFETSSSTMGFALYELAQNQEIQDKVRAEIKETLEKHEQQMTYDCLKDMSYLEKVISETLRKSPIIPHLLRKARNRYETSDPRYYLDAGTAIFIPVIAIHHDPKYYPEPEKFKPERFTDEEIQKRPQCSYLPFGDGPRNCIGLRFGKMQTKVGLAYLLKNFRFSIGPETEIPYIAIKKNVVMSPDNGIYLRVEKVQNKC